MKIGALYDTAKRYVPSVNPVLFTEMYKSALDKIAIDINITRKRETVSADSIDMSDVVKVYTVWYDGIPIGRVSGEVLLSDS